MNQKTNGLWDHFRRVSENTFKEMAVFTEDYVPSILIHREVLARDIVGMMADHKNILLLGLPSAGKTALVKRIFKELRQYDVNNRYLYVNCKEQKKSDMYHQLITLLNGESKQCGWSIFQYQSVLLQLIEGRQFGHVFICFDEFDSLAKQYHSYKDVLYFFSNTSLFSLIVIANEKDSWYDNRIDERTKTRLLFNEIYLDAYSIPEIADILKDRYMKGVNVNKIRLSDNEFEKIAEITFLHDEKLRLGIQALSDIINFKLNRDSDSDLEAWEIKALFRKRDDRAKMLYYTNFAPHHQAVLDIICSIKERRMKGDKSLYATVENITKIWNDNCKHVKSLTEKSTKTIRSYLAYLREFRIIEEKKKEDGESSSGRKKLVYVPNFDISNWIIEKNKNSRNEF